MNILNIINGFIASKLATLSPKFVLNLAYFHHRGKFPNLKNPSNLSEIWISKLLGGEFNKYFFLADKYEVRNYVKQRGLDDILTPLIAVYEKSTDVEYNDLPLKFALKANWGAGMNLICTNKFDLHPEFIKNIIDKWLNSPLCIFTESHYNLIKRKIVCEDFIDDGNGGFPIDYKFICLKGNPYCVLVCSGREKGKADYIPYDMSFNAKLDFCIDKHDASEFIGKPSNFDKMVSIASILSSGLDLVRVDLYSDGTRIWFGEMTLTPDGCIFRRWTDKAINEMGHFYLSN